MKDILKYTFLVVAVYFFINNPIFQFMGSMGSIKLLYPLAIVLLFKYQNEFRSMVSLFGKELRLLFVIIIISAFRTIVGGDFSLFYMHIVMLIELTIIPASLVILMSKGGDSNNFINVVIYVGCVGAIISTLCLLVPQVDEFVKYRLCKTSDRSFWEYRGFGMSETLSSFYSFNQAIIMVLSLFYTKGRKWIYIVLPLFFLSVLLNARTGVIIAAVSIALYFVFNRNFTMLFGTVVGSVLVIYSFNYILSTGALSDKTTLFVSDFFEQIDSMIDGGGLDEEGTASTLVGRMWILPDSIDEWLMGRGINLFRESYGNNSDVGYIIQLNYGGLLYIYPWMILLLTMFKRMNSLKIESIFICVFVVVFAIANFKGNYLWNSGSLRLIVLLYMSYIFSNHKYYATNNM